MQLRLQESAVSLAVANGDAQDVESSASDHVPQQVHPTGTRVCVCASGIILQMGAPVRMVSCGRNGDSDSLT